MPVSKPRPTAPPAVKRKRLERSSTQTATPPDDEDVVLPAVKRRASSRAVRAVGVNPDLNKDVLDAPNATRASPDAAVNEEVVPGLIKSEQGTRAESPLSEVSDLVKDQDVKEEIVSGKVKNEVKSAKPATNTKARSKNAEQKDDPEFEGDEDEEVDELEVKEALARPPPVNSDYLPLPWKGRLGYACLNTYLRNSNPPVFTSRTCRIQSILEHRYPLRDPTQPEHATKNRPDRSKPADIELGRRYVENLCLANVKDIIKMVRWNEKYHIRFFRLSSEMFPFASHPEYGYKLAPFASEALAEAGKVIAELGHRVTTHPGQFTQLGSPRKPVIDNAIRDLEYHDEMLSLLKLPPQQNRDAIMVLHMGGVFDGKAETLDRFRTNYAKLSPSIKNRLVLENDDVSWSVHDLLPVCEELNIPMVLDFHHHNIIFNAGELREGTRDIMNLFPRIKATWDRKNIRQKMHYSEPTPPAITGRQRRKHSPRVATLPPCADDMDLMIEAKDKEQAVFELMRNFKLPGYNVVNDILPYERPDDNKFVLAAVAAVEKKKKQIDKAADKKNKAAAKNPNLENDDDEDQEKLQESLKTPDFIPEDEIGMGGPQNRVYWPPGMEEWLRPKKREVKKKDDKPSNASTKSVKAETDAAHDKSDVKTTPAPKKRAARAPKQAAEPTQDMASNADAAIESDPDATPATKKAKAAMRAKSTTSQKPTTPKPAVKKAPQPKKSRNTAPTPSTSEEVDENEESELSDDSESAASIALKSRRKTASAVAPIKRAPPRAQRKKVVYAEVDEEDDE